MITLDQFLAGSPLVFDSIIHGPVSVTYRRVARDTPWTGSLTIRKVGKRAKAIAIYPAPEHAARNYFATVQATT